MPNMKSQVVPQSKNRMEVTIEMPPSINEKIRATSAQAERGILDEVLSRYERAGSHKQQRARIHTASHVERYQQKTVKTIRAQVQSAGWKVYTDDWYALLYPVPAVDLRRNDVDNYLKIGIDCLQNGKALWNDNRNVHIETYKVPAVLGCPLTVVICRLSLISSQLAIARTQITYMGEIIAKNFEKTLIEAGVYEPYEAQKRIS